MMNNNKTVYKIKLPGLEAVEPQPARTETQICGAMGIILEKALKGTYLGDEVKILQDIMQELGMKPIEKPKPKEQQGLNEFVVKKKFKEIENNYENIDFNLPPLVYVQKAFELVSRICVDHKIKGKFDYNLNLNGSGLNHSGEFR